MILHRRLAAASVSTPTTSQKFSQRKWGWEVSPRSREKTPNTLCAGQGRPQKPWAAEGHVGRVFLWTQCPVPGQSSPGLPVTSTTGQGLPVCPRGPAVTVLRVHVGAPQARCPLRSGLPYHVGSWVAPGHSSGPFCPLSGHRAGAHRGGPSGLDVHFSGVGSHRFCSLMPLGENGRYLLRELATSACLHPNGLFASLWKDLEEREDFSIQSQRLEWAPQWRGCEAPGPLVLGWSWCDNSGRGSWRVGWHQEELEDRQQTRPWVWPVQGGGPSWTDLLSLAVLRLCCQHLQPQAGLVSRHTCLHHHRVPRSSTQSAPERRRLHPLPLT